MGDRVLVLLSEIQANGGVQRFNRTLLAAGERLHAPCCFYSLNDADSSLEELRRSAIEIRGFQRSKVKFALAVMRTVLDRRYRAVLVGHFHLLTLGVAASFMKWPRRPQVILVAHGTEVWSKVRGVSRLALGFVNRILCVSQFTLTSIHAQAPELPAALLEVFPNSLSESWIGRFEGRADEPLRLDLPKKFVLSVGRITKHDRTKGMFTVIEALSQLSADLHYIIAGAGDDTEFLRDMASTHGVSDRVHLLGAVSDGLLRSLYRHCCAFVLPSSQEGFGIVFLEAMYFGAPVVAASEKGAVDVIQHEQTGLLVPYADADAVRLAIQRILSEAHLRERLSRQGRAMVTGEGRFAFGAFIRRCADVLGVAQEAGTTDASSSKG